MSSGDVDLDVAVAGGGAAGLYCAWRIATAPEPQRVAVFEATDRLGGRLYTVTPDGAERLRAELGGIAVLSTHRLVVEATDALGLAREPLLGGDPHNLLFLRGRRFRADQWSDPDAVPYELADGERGRTPEEIFGAAVERVVPGLGEMSAAEWDRAKREAEFEGRPLHEVGLWNLLERLVSPEAFRLIADAGGFRTEFQNWNAAEALIDMSQGWPAEARYEHLREGFEALPAALAERVREAGGEIAVGHRLDGVQVRGDGSDAELQLSFAVDGKERGRQVRARRLILAVPHGGLEALAPGTPLVDSADFRRDLDSVSTVPLFHLMLAYEHPWWRELGIESGRSATDLPLQSCFYLGTEAGGRSLALVGYSSAEAIEFWDGYIGPRAPDAEPRPAPPPEPMLREVTRQLAELHGTEVPDPDWALLMDWRADPYRGASHRWAVGARSWEVIPRMRRPLAGAPIHICGEAWSDLQGWTEGALRSAERVLREEVGLGEPEWMSPDAYLGP